MNYDIVFNADGSVSLPDLPADLFPAVRALRAPLPKAAAGTVGACAEQGRSNRPELGRLPDCATPLSCGRSPAWAKQPKARDRATTPLWQRTRHTPVPLTPSALAQASTDVLWDLHAAQTEARARRVTSGERITLFDLKVELARRSLLACDLCARRCGADRWHGESDACGSGREASVTRVFLNWSEEPHLRPGISIFMSGCNWDCVYCQYPENLDAHAGQAVTPTRLAARIAALWRQGATNIHWVGGNPDQHLWTVLRTLQECETPIPVVWNTNGYTSPTTLRLLDSVVDVYLVDFRHGTSACAQRYGVPSDSVAILRRNLHQIAQQDAALIVRHLQLPGHFDCCTAPILRWLAAELPDAPLNLMHGQYRPARLAYRYPEINRRLKPAERKKAMHLACDLDLMLVI